jgi:hypothetical protein
MNAAMIQALPFEDRIKHVAKQLLGSKMAEFALDTGDKLTLAFEKQRKALMDLLQVCQSDLDDLITDDILFPLVKVYGPGGDLLHERDMDVHEQTEYRRTLIDAAAQRLATSVSTLEKMVNLFTKMTGGGVGQAMLAVAKSGLERSVQQLPEGTPRDDLGYTGPSSPKDETTPAGDYRRRFRAGRGAVVDV